MLTFVLQHTEPHAHYFGPFTGLAKHFLKKLLELWGEADETVRIAAFLNVRALALRVPYPFIAATLKGIYLAYVRNARFSTPQSAPTLQFLENCVVELYGLDAVAAYQHAFVYIRQLAVHLRQAHAKARLVRALLAPASHAPCRSRRRARTKACTTGRRCTASASGRASSPRTRITTSSSSCAPPRLLSTPCPDSRRSQRVPARAGDPWRDRPRAHGAPLPAAPALHADAAPPRQVHACAPSSRCALPRSRPSRRDCCEAACLPQHGLVPPGDPRLRRLLQEAVAIFGEAAATEAHPARPRQTARLADIPGAPCPVPSLALLLTCSCAQNLIFAETYYQLVAYFALYSRSIAFPELMVPAAVLLKKFVKRCKTADFTTKIKTLLDAVCPLSAPASPRLMRSARWRSRRSSFRRSATSWALVQRRTER